jgi:Tfp pilus assembly protein PilO
LTLFFYNVLGFLLRARNRPAIAACLVLGVVLGVANYFLWQKREDVTRRHAEITQKGQFVLESLVKRTTIDADLAALQTAMEQIEDNLIDEVGMEVNLGYFYRLERMTKVKLVRLNQLGALPPNGAAYKTVPFSMQVVGSYRNSMSFLRALESGPRVLRIRQSSFERANEGNADLLLDLTVEVLTKT